jgi:hypothetical protein
MDEFFVQGVVGGVLNRHKDKTLDKDRISTLSVEIAAVLDRATQFTNVKEMNIDEQNRNYNFIMDEMSQGEKEHLFNWQQDKKYIYESPDGRYVFRRLAGEKYTPEQKEEIDLRTGEPTGRTFADYPFSKGLAKDNPLSKEMWKGWDGKEEPLSKEYLDYWTCDYCNKNTHEVEYDYLGNGTNHLECCLKAEELQEKSDKIMKTLNKEFENYDLSKSESNENSKVDMSATTKRGKNGIPKK